MDHTLQACVAAYCVYRMAIDYSRLWGMWKLRTRIQSRGGYSSSDRLATDLRSPERRTNGRRTRLVDPTPVVFPLPKPPPPPGPGAASPLPSQTPDVYSQIKRVTDEHADEIEKLQKKIKKLEARPTRPSPTEKVKY